MKCIVIAFFATFFATPLWAQNTEYIEMSKEVDQEVWGDKDPVLENNKLPAEYKNESAVILARKQFVETNTERKGRSLLYIGKMHSLIKRTIRERIYINDKVSLEGYSQINFRQLQSKQSGPITKLRNYTFMGIRVTKADGSVQKINVDEASVKLDESSDGKKNKIAVPDLAIGDVLDYYITYFEQARADNDVDYFTFILGDEYPILNLGIKVLLDKRVAAQYQVINGAPDFKITKTEDDDNLLELAVAGLPKATNLLWISQSRQIPLARIKYSFADIVHGRGDYTRRGTIEKVTSPEDVEHSFVNLIKPYLAQLPVYTDVKSEWKKYAKEHNIDKENMDSILAFVHYYYRYMSFGQIITNNIANSTFDHFYDCSLGLEKLKQLEMVLKVMKTINAAFEADAEMVLVSDKNNVAYNDIFSLADLNFLLRVPRGDSKAVFYYFGSNLYAFNEIPAFFENESYKFIQQNSIFRPGKDMSQKKADLVNGKGVTPVTSYSDNNQTEDLLIEFDNADMQLLHIQRRTITTGHQRRGMQNSTMILENYLASERRILGKETDYEKEWTADRVFKKSWPDAELSMTKSRTEQKTKIEKEIADQYDSKPKEVKSFKVISDGFSSSRNPCTLDEEFSMDGWVKKAGNNYIVEAGKFVGGQLEIKADQKERKLDIYMPYARSFTNNIRVKIPDGYTVEGLDKLNKSVKNECGGFESSAKISGNELQISFSKYYANLQDPAANWNKIVAFVDAAFAFTKEKILLKKK